MTSDSSSRVCHKVSASRLSGRLWRYHHAPEIIGFVLEYTPNGRTTAGSLLYRRRKALAAGFQLHQSGDEESILLFRSQNPVHQILAISLVGAKRRRMSSPAQLEVLRRARLAFKESSQFRLVITGLTPPREFWIRTVHCSLYQEQV